MSEIQLLSEANELVRNGLRQAAIDLLIEYLDTNPDSPLILQAIGKTYLLDHQPEKAVTYLQKSLQAKASAKGQPSLPDNYSAESFDEHDMEFIDSEVDDFSDDFSFEYDSDRLNKENKGTQERKIIRITTTNLGRKRSDKTNCGFTIRYKSRKKPDIHKPTISTPAEKKTDVDEKEPDSKKSSSTPLDLLINNTSEQITDSIKVKEEAPEYQPTQIGLFDSDEPDDFEVGSTLDLFDDYEDQDDKNDEYETNLDQLYRDKDELPEELIWDDFEDIEEFDGDARREFDEAIDTDGKLSREQRASQVALEVIQNTDWDNTNHDLLQLIFVENGWTAAKTAIYRLINKGVEPEQLHLARKIKKFWSGNERYWTTFHRIKVDAFGKQAHDGYKQMSWLEAVRIINCFESLPDIEEIYHLVDDLFDEWYWNNRLRRSFKAFFKYLKYRTGSMNRTLPGSDLYSFHDLPEGLIDDGLLSEDYSFSEKHRELSEFGVLIESWPRPPKIIATLDGEEE